MTLNLPLLDWFWFVKYCQTSPNKNKSPNLWHVTSILVCCIFAKRYVLNLITVTSDFSGIYRCLPSLNWDFAILYKTTNYVTICYVDSVGYLKFGCPDIPVNIFRVNQYLFRRKQINAISFKAESWFYWNSYSNAVKITIWNRGKLFLN